MNQPFNETVTGQRLRILMVVDGFFPAMGGAEMQVRHLTRSLTALGHEVEIVAPRLVRSQGRSADVDGAPVHYLSYPRALKGIGPLWLMVKFASFLLIRRSRYDAIHIHIARNLAGVAGWLRPLLRARVIVKVSGAYEFQGGILDPELMHKPLHRWLNAGVRRVDALQCISRYTEQMLRKAGYPPARLVSLPNAVDCQRFQPRARTGGNALRVVFVGRHVPVKGIDTLIRAWSRLDRATPHRLVLAGAGPETAALKALCAELGVAGSVEFPGEVHDVPALLSRADVYAQASLREGLPNAVLEAMASGLPIVATRISGHEDVVDDGRNGLLVPVNDADALTSALATLLLDPAKRKRMGLASREVMEQRYCTEQVLSHLVALYRGVCPAPDAARAESGAAPECPSTQ